MNTFRRPTRPTILRSGWGLAVICGFSALLVLGLLLARAHMASASSGPAITSDQADYAPGSSVTLTGAGWVSGETVHIYVNDSVGNTWSLDSNPDPKADGSGGFTYSFSLPNTFIANYTATATGQTSGTATVTFTDANVNLDQFANLPGQGWQNGDLNSGNSAYHEGSVVPFRLAIDGLSSGSHTIHLNYDFTVGGHEAYDFLTSYNATENADVCSSVSTKPSSLCPVGTPNILAFPGDPFAPGGNTAAGENVNGAIALANLPTRQLSMWGGTPVSFSSVAHSGPAGTGNSSADILLTFSTSASCPIKTGCSVLLAWGGHIAQSGYWTQSAGGGPNGAGQVSGAPLHMQTESLDGRGGNNQDRSIQSTAITQAQDLTVSKTATASFTRTYAWTIAKSVDNPTPTIPAGGTGTFNYTVSVTPTGTDSGWTVSGTITVGNPNGSDFSGVNVADTIDNGGTCTVNNGTGVTVPAGQSVQLTYTCTFSSNPGSGTNTATASWDKTKYNTPDSQAPGTATYDFTNVNPKLVDNCVTVTDAFNSGNADTLGKVCAGNSPAPTNLNTSLANFSESYDSTTRTFTFTYSRSEQGVAGTCTTYNNTATFTTNTTEVTNSDSKSVKLCVALDLKVMKDATPGFTRTFTWAITKDVKNPTQMIADGSPATFNYTVTVTHVGTDSDWMVSGKITVTNPNDFESVTSVNVTDLIDNGGVCSVTNGTNLSIAAGGSVTLDYKCTYASAPSPSSGTNTATASWDQSAAQTPTGMASGTASVDFSTPTTVVDGSVSVTDTLGGPLGTVSSTDPSPTTFPYPYSFSGDPAGTCTTHDNTASYTTADTHTTDSASQTVTVCVGADLTVSKTASSSFTRTYVWNITKKVDKTLVEQIGGGQATFNYAVNVIETGFTDSAWVVSGTITVTNPNDWEAITANVTDGNCTVNGGTGVKVPASGSAQVSYSCTFSSGSSGTNTATATWGPAAAYTPDGSASGSANFAFTTPTMVANSSVTITDTFNGTTTTLMPTLNATDDPTAFTSHTYTYSYTVNVPTSNCVKYTNTATISQTGQFDSKTVEVCGPAKTGALTMGYWQNKNGQAIISGGASTSGVCNSGTWLRLYAPFQDLSATAKCTDVATYVYNIVKAANASGSSMNAMLKAQMLATALDVYFSDPALGGNKINAPAPIGGVSIDLTMICKMTDSSSGGNCGGSFENVSSAFGGATSLTVSQMLSYAASQSNAGGSVWYAQVKATQQLAKDAFDAINNQVAFAP